MGRVKQVIVGTERRKGSRRKAKETLGRLLAGRRVWISRQ